MLAIPSQEPGALERFGLTRKEADREAWTVERGGRRHAGAAAINRVLAAMPSPWSWPAHVYGLGLAAAFEEMAYRWFARNRARFHRFGVTPECDEPGAGCA